MIDKPNHWFPAVLDEEGYEVIPPLPAPPKPPARKGVKCGLCKMKFPDGELPAFACRDSRCPMLRRRMEWADLKPPESKYVQA